MVLLVRDLHQEYTVSSNTWTARPVLTAARANVAAAVVDNRIHVLGGSTGNAAVAWNGSNSNYAYDILTATWSTSGQ